MPVRRMSAREARANFSELLGLVYYTKEPVLVERNGRPFAVMISPEQYETMRKEIERAWTTLDRVQAVNADKDPDAVLRDVTAAVEAVREENYGQRKKTPQSRG